MGKKLRTSLVSLHVDAIVLFSSFIQESSSLQNAYIYTLFYQNDWRRIQDTSNASSNTVHA